MKVHNTLVFFTFLLFFGCNSRSLNNSGYLRGSWSYFFDGMYFELHVTDNYLIYQSDILGTEILKYTMTDDNKEIKICKGDNDPNPSRIIVVSINKSSATIRQGMYKLSLKKLYIEEIDLAKLTETDSYYYKSYINAFRKRKIAALQELDSSKGTIR